jgi:hypothetical protein
LEDANLENSNERSGPISRVANLAGNYVVDAFENRRDVHDSTFQPITQDHASLNR